MNGEIAISVGDVNDVEAHVLATYNAVAIAEGEPEQGEPVALSGTLRGPFCELARTLPATFEFRMVSKGEYPSAEAVVPDPCVWSHALPHVYRVQVEVRRGDRVVAEYQGEVGLKRVRSAARHDFSPG